MLEFYFLSIMLFTFNNTMRNSNKNTQTNTVRWTCSRGTDILFGDGVCRGARRNFLGGGLKFEKNILFSLKYRLPYLL